MARDGIPEQINIRLNPECRAALEAYRVKREAAVRREISGFRMNPTEALRLLIIEALNETERKP